jgi:DNA-binding LacI/PurR family transcriptional regulator
VFACRRQVAYLQARHLLELGHRRIRFTMMHGRDWLLTQRLLGLKAALKEAGERFVPEHVSYLGAGSADMCQIGYDIVRQANWAACGVTGVTALNDLIGLGMLRALHEAGVSVPERLSLIGSENQAPAAWYHVPLTTVDWNLEQQAATAVEWLVERLGDGKTRPRRLAVQPKLVVRKSTAAPMVG